MFQPQSESMCQSFFFLVVSKPPQWKNNSWSRAPANILPWLFQTLNLYTIWNVTLICFSSFTFYWSCTMFQQLCQSFFLVVSNLDSESSPKKWEMNDWSRAMLLSSHPSPIFLGNPCPPPLRGCSYGVGRPAERTGIPHLQVLQ